MVAPDGELGGTFLEHWRSRLEMAARDEYLGTPLAKLPEDLLIYERLLWMARVTCVVEVGTYAGGSALWFLDRIRTLRGHGRVDGTPRVITIDVDQGRAREHLAGFPDAGADIVLLERDVREAGLADAVDCHIPSGSTVMLVEDGAHEEDTTFAALDQLSGLVSPGSWLVVEDGVVDVDALRVSESWPRGVLPAIDRWRATSSGAGFEPRPDVDIYGVTCNPGGYFQRVAAQQR